MTEVSREAVAFRHHPAVIGQELDGQLVLIHTETNDLFELNSTAARFWELLGEGADLGEIKRRLLEEYDVDRSQIETETAAMLSQFLDLGLIQRA